MDYEEKKAWLKTLKVGDEVAIIRRYRTSLATIEKITHNGKFIYAGGYKFKDGSYKVGDWSWIEIGKKSEHKEITE